MPVRFSCLVFLTLLATAEAGGSFSPAAPSDIVEGSKIHRLAAFAFRSIQTSCVGSNSIACGYIGALSGGASFFHVRSAETQVVSGINYAIEAETSIGHLALRVYEQAWTSTLEVTSATLSLAPQGASLAIVQLPLVDGPLALDAEIFATFGESADAPAIDHGPASCKNGMVWNECGSPCDPTCSNRAPLCATVCSAKCACPSGTYLQDDGCVAESECPQTTEPAEITTSTEPPCVPHVGTCPRNYSPVCANEVQYDNLCIARAACVEEEDAIPGECILEGTHQDHQVLPGATAGGFQPVDELSAGSKMHHLANFALDGIKNTCVSSNSRACGLVDGATVSHVLRGSTQVVAGVNYKLDVETSAGRLELTIFEQAWTNTLQVTQAVLVLPGVALSDNERLVLIEEALALDAAAFSASSLSSISSALLIGGAPVGGATHGGHYTGSDILNWGGVEQDPTAVAAALAAADAPASEETSLEAPRTPEMPQRPHGAPPPSYIPKDHVGEFVKTKTALPERAQASDDDGSLIMSSERMPAKMDSGDSSAVWGVFLVGALLVFAVAVFVRRAQAEAARQANELLPSSKISSDSFTKEHESQSSEVSPDLRDKSIHVPYGSDIA